MQDDEEPICDGCGKPFTPEEWENHHDEGLEEIYHDGCCPRCNAEEIIERKDAELAALRAEVARLRAALEVYADNQHWAYNPVGQILWYDENNLTPWAVAANALAGATCSE